MSKINSISYADLKEVFPRFNEESPLYFEEEYKNPKCRKNQIYKKVVPKFKDCDNEAPPLYTEKIGGERNEEEELNVIYNLKKNDRIRRIRSEDGERIILESRNWIFRKYTKDSRIKTLEDLRRLSTMQMDRLKFIEGVTVLYTTTYRNDKKFKEEAEKIIRVEWEKIEKLE